MSDCFFDLRACATQPCALAFKPMTTVLRLKVADILRYTLNEALSFKRRGRVCQSGFLIPKIGELGAHPSIVLGQVQQFVYLFDEVQCAIPQMYHGGAHSQT